MTTTRTPIDRPARKRITPEVVRLWKLITALEDSGLILPREYFKAVMDFHLLIGWKPFEVSPLYVRLRCAVPPQWTVRDGEASVEEWKNAVALMHQLEEAAA